MQQVLVFPRWRSNPYLNMLYVGVRAEGWRMRGSRHLPEFVETLAKLEAGDVVHVHWTHPICQSRPDEASARTALDSFKDAVEAATGRGVRLVWTVHNQLPHATQYRELERELSAFLAATAWRIIQLNRETRAAVAADFDLPAEKLVTLRHASYRGIYAPAPSQAAARAALGVPAGSPTIAFVGQIHPYKGVATLLAAAGRLAEQIPDLTVLLAGRTADDQLAALEEALPAGVRVIRHHEYVPDDELGTWFAAADLMVFPYRRVLNSGSLLASATFGRPAILPGEQHLVAEFGDQEWVSFFDPSDDSAAGLADAIAQALPTAAERRAAATSYALEYTTYDMAWDYFDILAGETPSGRQRAVGAGPAEDPELSVVIPTHDIEDYVDELLRSVRSSTGVRLEIIVVDDASSDGTWDVVQRHAAVDPRVRAVRSPGAGGGQARDYGVELARGEYLAFADGDDLVPPRAYSRMLAAARRDDVDLVVGNFVKFTTTAIWASDRTYTYAKERHGVSLGDAPGIVRHRACWNRVVRRAFWQQHVLPFPGVPRSNDIVALTSALTAAGRITVDPGIAYVYRVRPGEGSMLSGVGGTAATVSYLTEETTCARLVAQVDDPAVTHDYWDGVLSADTRYHLLPYLRQAPEDPAGSEDVRKCHAALLALAPAAALTALAPELQAAHALLRTGDLAAGAALAAHLEEVRELTPSERDEVVAAAGATGQLSSEALRGLRDTLSPAPAKPRPASKVRGLLRRVKRLLGSR